MLSKHDSCCAHAVYSLNLGRRSDLLYVRNAAHTGFLWFVAFSCKGPPPMQAYSTVAISFWAPFGSTLMPAPIVEDTAKLFT